MNIIRVPSGIGDVSWMYSKLCFAEPMDWEIADGWPYRTKQFLDLLPGVRSSRYGNFIYKDIIVASEAIGRPEKWGQVEAQQELFLEANMHLEEGRRLEDWLPDLPTDFHYRIPTSEVDKVRARELVRCFESPLWGVSAASYRGSEAWDTWGFDQWKEFLDWFGPKAQGTIILLGGFWDDLTASLASSGFHDLVGKTSIGCAIEILRHLDGYIGFSSGLGVLGTVVNTKTFMLWPDHQWPLATSWAPPEMIDSGRYAVSRWDKVSNVKRLVERWLAA